MSLLCMTSRTFSSRSFFHLDTFNSLRRPIFLLFLRPFFPYYFITSDSVSRFILMAFRCWLVIFRAPFISTKLQSHSCSSVLIPSSFWLISSLGSSSLRAVSSLTRTSHLCFFFFHGKLCPLNCVWVTWGNHVLDTATVEFGPLHLQLPVVNEGYASTLKDDSRPGRSGSWLPQQFPTALPDSECKSGWFFTTGSPFRPLSELRWCSTERPDRKGHQNRRVSPVSRASSEAFRSSR